MLPGNHLPFTVSIVGVKVMKHHKAKITNPVTLPQQETEVSPCGPKTKDTESVIIKHYQTKTYKNLDTPLHHIPVHLIRPFVLIGSPPSVDVWMELLGHHPPGGWRFKV